MDSLCTHILGGGLTGVQALYDGGGIDQVTGAQWTCEVGIQICDFNPVGLHFIHVDRSAEETQQQQQQGVRAWSPRAGAQRRGGGAIIMLVGSARALSAVWSMRGYQRAPCLRLVLRVAQPQQRGPTAGRTQNKKKRT